MIRYLEFQKTTVTDFLAGPASASRTRSTRSTDQPAPRHYLRQLGYIGAETLGVHPSRGCPTNRGNGYLAPGALTELPGRRAGDLPQLRLPQPRLQPATTAGSAEALERGDPHRGRPDPGAVAPVEPSFAPCISRSDFPGGFGDGRFPTLFSDP